MVADSAKNDQQDPTAPADAGGSHDARVLERRDNVARAWALSQEGKSRPEIAEILGKSVSTVNAYFYDPKGEKIAARKAAYRGECQRCGAPTSGGNGPSSAREFCRKCAPLATQKWDEATVLAALLLWREKTGELPSSYDLNATWAAKRLVGATEALQAVPADARPDVLKRRQVRLEEATRRLELLDSGDFPTSATVREVFGDFATARARATGDAPVPSPTIADGQ